MTNGQVTFNGNVGPYFAAEARGGYVILNGECGWRGCYTLREGARVDINGIAGFDFLDQEIPSRFKSLNYGGVVHINPGIVDGVEVDGQIRSLEYAGNLDAECYLNGRRVYLCPDYDQNFITFDPSEKTKRHY